MGQCASSDTVSIHSYFHIQLKKVWYFFPAELVCTSPKRKKSKYPLKKCTVALMAGSFGDYRQSMMIVGWSIFWPIVSLKSNYSQIFQAVFCLIFSLKVALSFLGLYFDWSLNYPQIFWSILWLLFSFKSALNIFPPVMWLIVSYKSNYPQIFRLIYGQSSRCNPWYFFLPPVFWLDFSWKFVLNFLRRLYLKIQLSSFISTNILAILLIDVSWSSRWCLLKSFLWWLCWSICWTVTFLQSWRWYFGWSFCCNLSFHRYFDLPFFVKILTKIIP